MRWVVCLSSVCTARTKTNPVRSLKEATTWSRSDMAFLLKYYDVIAMCCGLYMGLVLAQHAQTRTQKRMFKKHGVVKRAVRWLKDETTWSRSDMAFLLKYYDVIAMYIHVMLSLEKPIKLKANF